MVKRDPISCLNNYLQKVIFVELLLIKIFEFKYVLFPEKHYKEMKLINGRELIMYQNYTFSFHGPKKYKRYLICSQRSSANCSASLKLDDDGNIVQGFNTYHNHDAPKYKKIQNGCFVKL